MEAALRRAEVGTDSFSDADLAALMVNQETIEGDALGWRDRVILGLLGEKFVEQRAAFNALYPSGDIIPIDGTEIVLYRTDPGQQYRRVDQPFLEAFGLGELVADVGELLAENAGPITGEVALLLATRGRGRGRPPGAPPGAPAPRPPFGQRALEAVSGGLRAATLGALGGEAVQQAVQSAAGTQRDTFGEQTMRAASEAAFALLGGAAGNAIGTGVGLLRGQGLVRITPEGQAAEEAVERVRTAQRAEGIPEDELIQEPLPFQLTDNPLVRRFAQLSQAMVPSIGRALRRQQELTNQAARSRTDPRSLSTFISQSRRALDEGQRQIERYLVAAMQLRSRPGVSVRPADEGRLVSNLRRSLNDWWRVSGEHIDELYQTARSFESPEFDLRTLQNTAARLDEGVVAPGPEVTNMVPRVNPDGSQAVDAAGNVIMDEVTEREAIQLRQLDAELQRIVTQIQQIDPDLVQVEGFADPSQILLELERDLYDLTIPTPASDRVRTAQFRARELRTALRDTLDNPTNDGAEFVAAYQLARNQARKRFDTREAAGVTEAFAAIDLKSAEGARFVRGLSEPGSWQTLAHLRRALGQEGLDLVRRGFHAKLGDDIGGIAAKLDTYDPQTLRILLRPNEERALRNASAAWQRLERSGVRQALQDQSQVRAFTSQLLEEGIERKTAMGDALEVLIRRNGGLDGDFGRAVRASINDQIWERATARERGGFLKVQAKLLDEVVKEFEDAGILRFLHPTTRGLWRDIAAVQRIADLSQIDAGTSFATASAASDIRGAVTSGSTAGLITIIENIGVGRILTSPAGRRILIGRPGAERTSELAAWTLTGALLGTLAGDFENHSGLPPGFSRIAGGTAPERPESTDPAVRRLTR